MDTPEIPIINIADFTYNLPLERIAEFPLQNRDFSKLLVVDSVTETIRHTVFQEVHKYIQSGSVCVFNNTKVIPARLNVQKSTGGEIELLLIKPVSPTDIQQSLSQTTPSIWLCMVGGKNVRVGSVLTAEVNNVKIHAMVLSREENKAEVEFTVEPTETTLASAINIIGSVPLPPYIKRNPTAEDIERYQTVYAQHNGSVAAPTAGLHFTAPVLESLQNNDVSLQHVTLHVGLGTFLPVQTDLINQHTMHKERITVDIPTLQSLRDFFVHRITNQRFVCVGTTSLRTIESLYWIGVKILRKEIDITKDSLLLSQWECYRYEQTELPTPQESFSAIMDELQKNSMTFLSGETEIIIIPGYLFRCCDTLITNFHQPKSTLILLVAAFVGNEFWKTVYNSALDNDYRFLSYGDSSILFR